MGKFEDTIEWMFRQLPMFQRQGPVALKLDLSRMYELLALLDNPHEGQNYLHIAGTNGKGTSSHIVASVLQEAGLRVGMYTSPHYKDFRERIKINGQFIEKNFIVEFIEEHKALFKPLQPSFFELTFLMSIAYFKSKQPDVIILETGMGGRLDSTNVVTPLACLITNIGYDHQQFLGDTLAEIAFEKGGIIKPSVPVVIGEYQEEVTYVFEQLASELKAPLSFAQDELVLSQRFKGEFIYQEEDREFIIQTDIGGPFVERNLRSSIAFLKTLSKYHPEVYTFKASDLIQGLSRIVSNTFYISRWYVQSTKPLIVLDSAHNKEGLSDALESINDMNQGQLHIVFATVADKDLKSILHLFPKEAKYYLTRANIPRAMDEQKLYGIFNEFGLKGAYFENSESAFSAAKQAMCSNDSILVAGSIFLIAELI